MTPPGRLHIPTSEHVVASISDPGAGPSYSVPALTAALRARGAPATLHTVRGWRGSGADKGGCAQLTDHLVAHSQDFRRTPLLGAACLSADLERALRNAARTSDILHSHGLWLMPNIYPARAARGGRARHVVSPRGMLGPEALAFSSLKKQAFWRLFQARALRDAACLHATSEAEWRDIRASGLANPVAVIRNGIDLPPERPAPDPERPHTVLSLGRVHPKKGLDNLVRAWGQIEARHAQWRLRIVGPAELSHDGELRAMATSLGLRRLTIEGAAFGADRAAAYGDADLFVLPTRGENFAMTVAEALAAGVPVISTKGAPWAGLETEGCGWWVDHGVEPMAAALNLALDAPRDALQAMGDRGRAWMSRDFSWDRIAEDMLAVYGWLAAGGQQPSTVRLT